MNVGRGQRSGGRRVCREGGLGLFAAVLVWGVVPASAWAWPVDQRVELQSGHERFFRIPALEWLDVKESQRVRPEVLKESDELLLTGVSPGQTQLMLAAEGKLAVWSVRVVPGKGRGKVADSGADSASAVDPTSKSGNGAESPTEEAARSLVKKACPGVESPEPSQLQVQVKTSACRRALLELFRTDAYLSRDVSVTFEVPALQAQLRDIEQGWKDAGLTGLTARYVGAGLVLEGEMPAEAHTRALWVVFDRSVGRVALEDRIRRIEPAAETETDAPEETP